MFRRLLAAIARWRHTRRPLEYRPEWQEISAMTRRKARQLGREEPRRRQHPLS